MGLRVSKLTVGPLVNKRDVFQRRIEHMTKQVAFVFAALLISACSSSSKTGLATAAESPKIKITEADALPPPTMEDTFGERRAYLIGPADRLGIDVYGIPELSRETQVDSAGEISMPLVGNVVAAGLSPSQLADVIEKGLRGRYVRNPDVSVSVKEVSSQNYTIDGEVTTPGLYPIVGKMSLMRAVASARGATEFAKLEDVVVFRTVSGQRMAALFNVKQIRRGVYSDPDIYANDVIVVGNSQARRIFKDVITASPLLAGPLIAILQNN
jgi:polysaccharide export outer membrane protein